MKKVTALLLAILLLTAPVALAAFDLGSMTTEQLLSLRSDIQAELLSRGKVKSFTVPSGTYEVGVDFPAGTYSVSLESGFLTSLMVGVSEKALAAYDVTGMHAVSQESIIGKLKLIDGEFVAVNGTPLVFSLYSGLKFD